MAPALKTEAKVQIQSHLQEKNIGCKQQTLGSQTILTA
jgi:hypothetical protein